MAGMQVDNIRVGELDSAGNRVTVVYAKVSNCYAVYCTDTNVMVHFSDDKKLGSEQRLCLVSLQDMRGKIEELSADLLRQENDRTNDVVSDIRRQLAFALQIALQGQKEVALLRMTRLYGRLESQKESSARLYYLLSASTLLVAVIFLSWFAASAVFVEEPSKNRLLVLLWQAFAVGGVGAFFSISITIREKKFRSQTILRDNLIDAGLRILIGGISAVVLVDIVFLEVVRLKVGDIEFGNSLAWPHVIILGIIAGFSERFVPDMLGKLGASAADSWGVNKISEPVNITGVVRDENSPLTGGTATVPLTGNGPPSPQVAINEDHGEVEEHEEIDGCCDQPISEDAGDQITDDIELPEAQGGVADDDVATNLEEEK